VSANLFVIVEIEHLDTREPARFKPLGDEIDPDDAGWPLCRGDPGAGNVTDRAEAELRRRLYRRQERRSITTLPRRLEQNVRQMKNLSVPEPAPSGTLMCVKCAHAEPADTLP